MNIAATGEAMWRRRMRGHRRRICWRIPTSRAQNRLEKTAVGAELRDQKAPSSRARRASGSGSSQWRRGSGAVRAIYSIDQMFDDPQRAASNLGRGEVKAQAASETSRHRQPGVGSLAHSSSHRDARRRSGRSTPPKCSKAGYGEDGIEARGRRGKKSFRDSPGVMAGSNRGPP